MARTRSQAELPLVEPGPGTRGTKRPIGTDCSDQSATPEQQRRRQDSFHHPATNHPIEFWAKEGTWPPNYFEPELERVLARKKFAASLNRKRSNSIATSTTPSDQKPREEKSAFYLDARYETLLEMKGSFMTTSSLGITSASKELTKNLLEAKQTVPKDTLFRDDIFESTCQKIHNKNEARVIRDISRLIVPSAEILATFGANHLDVLVESVNEGWNNAIPLVGTRPQPDYSVGFSREAFSDEQLSKLSPFIGDFLDGDQSMFMATYYMYFPFLTCEVKCGATSLEVADRQNAHSMTLAVRATAELFRAVKRESEVDRQILAFSISHSDKVVRIYGHYPVMDEKDIKYYRHFIRGFDFTDGKEKWTSYQFTKNVYDLWMPSHFKKICSAIDQLPADLDLGFDDPSLPLSN
ncbi:hypothetical protein V8C35DRAFT_140486 [Trichoderma chlorosporum]